MGFDEQYNEEFYRYDTVRSFVDNKCDGLIVIGTALETGLASSIVKKIVKKVEIPVVEVNLMSCIKEGKVFKVMQKSEVCLPIML